MGGNRGAMRGPLENFWQNYHHLTLTQGGKLPRINAGQRWQSSAETKRGMIPPGKKAMLKAGGPMTHGALRVVKAPFRRFGGKRESPDRRRLENNAGWNAWRGNRLTENVREPELRTAHSVSCYDHGNSLPEGLEKRLHSRGALGTRLPIFRQRRNLTSCQRHRTRGHPQYERRLRVRGGLSSDDAWMTGQSADRLRREVIRKALARQWLPLPK